MHCERWIPGPCDATTHWERRQKLRNLGYLKALWHSQESTTCEDFWKQLHLKTSLKFVFASFANHGDLDKISQLGSSRWHSTFCNNIPTSIWRPQSAHPGTNVPHCPLLVTSLPGQAISQRIEDHPDILDFIFFSDEGNWRPIPVGLVGIPKRQGLCQGFPTSLWTCTPSAFSQMSMYPSNFLWRKVE